MVNEWTRDDLPDHVAIRDVDYMHGDGTRSRVIDLTLDMVVRHLNAHHPKPGRSAHDEQVAQLVRMCNEADLKRTRAEDNCARLRRAHEIVEGERDQARRERDMWKEKCLDTYEALHQARAERDEAVARAEAAEARTAPAVSRADVAETLSRCINPEMWNVTFPSVVSEVCDLFGIEAEQAADPLLDKAQEFAALADWELTDREAELLHTVAAHVLGQEDRHVD